MPWQFAAATDIGGRSEQQDRLAILHSSDRRSYLVVLADGMGGHRDGAVAAQTVIDTAQKCFSGQDIEDPRSFLVGLCIEAHRAIRALGAGAGKAPGSTCALLYLRNAEAYWAHVGDSRLYHIRQGESMYRTKDHSKAQLLLDRGRAQDPEVAGSSHQLYMCLGGSHEVVPDFNASQVRSEDLFMLCSDGFWGQVEPHEVAERIEGSPLGDEQARDLVDIGRRRANGTGDNLSLALARWEGSANGGTRGLLERLLQRWR